MLASVERLAGSLQGAGFVSISCGAWVLHHVIKSGNLVSDGGMVSPDDELGGICEARGNKGKLWESEPD